MLLAHPGMKTLICVCLILSFIVMPSAGNAAQEQDRIIVKRLNSLTPNGPVTLSVVRTKKGLVEIGKEFKDDDDWVKGLTVRVNNISNKNIRFISINFSFDRPEGHETTNEPPLVHSLTYGSRIHVKDDPPQLNQVKTLAPESFVDISLPDKTYEALGRALNKLKYPSSIKRLQIYLAEVIFNDDTAWVSGHWFRLDPKNPDKWIPIEQQSRKG